MTRLKVFFGFYLLIIVGLFLYSFTQVDLSLTLSRVSIWQGIQKSFQYIGFYQRPLSTAIYLILLFLLYSSYIYLLYLTLKKKIQKKQIWMLIIATSVVLLFSYNAFSKDIYNYIFDAKILTFYHQNPYLHKALDFPGDPMLSFMHWTHRTYPYGPVWLLLSIPPSIIGLNFFLVTYFLFKAMIVGFFLGTVYLIGKIVKKVNPENENFALVFFALNPLMIIENLVSGHNDISMMFFALLGIYFLLFKKNLLSIVVLIVSVLVKQVTVFLIFPVVLFFLSKYQKIKLSEENFFRSLVLFMSLGLIYVITKIEIQPWYFIWIMPFIALLKPNKYVAALSIGISLGLLLRYAPYLYQGDWNGIVGQIKFYNSLLVPIIFVFFIFLRDIFKKSH